MGMGAKVGVEVGVRLLPRLVMMGVIVVLLLGERLVMMPEMRAQKLLAG